MKQLKKEIKVYRAAKKTYYENGQALEKMSHSAPKHKEQKKKTKDSRKQIIEDGNKFLATAGKLGLVLSEN